MPKSPSRGLPTDQFQCDRCRKRKVRFPLQVSISISLFRSVATGNFHVQIADPQDLSAKHPIVLLDRSGREF